MHRRGPEFKFALAMNVSAPPLFSLRGLVRILTRLEVITLREPFVLIDSSVARLLPDPDDDLFYSFYTIGSYRQIPIDCLKKEINVWRSFYYCIKRGNVQTVPEVHKELSKCAQILSEKYDFFEEHTALFRGLKRSRQSSPESGNGSFCLEKECFEELKLLVDNSCQQAKSSLFVPNDPAAYNLILEMVCLLSREGCLKKEYVYAEDYYDPNSLAPKKDLQTDEKIVAAALYRSLIETKKSAIVCKDKHFQSLLSGCRNIFAEDMPFQDYLLDRFIRHPITLYNYGYVEKMFARSSGFNLLQWVPRKFDIRNAQSNRFVRNQISDKITGLVGLLAFGN